MCIYIIYLFETIVSKELEIIKEIAVKNGYEKKLIDQLLFNKIKKSTLESIYSQKSQKEIDKAKIVLPYYGQISEKLKQKIK